MTKTIEQARREAFEDWCDGKGYGSFTTRELLWPCYNAALDSLCVELPAMIGDFRYDQAIDQCRSAIHAAGVKTR